MVKAKETMGRQAGIITKGNFIKYLDDYNKTLKDKIFLDSLLQAVKTMKN